MAYRFVRATPNADRLTDLRERLDSGETGEMEPFGRAMRRARIEALPRQWERGPETA